MLRTCLIAGAILAMLGARAQNMMTGEYWVDNDPGFGEAIAFDPDLTGIPEETVQFDVDPADLTPGMHTIGYRTKDSNGRWSLTNLRAVYIAPAPANANIVRTEYFLNSDPGWGGGSNANVSGSDDIAAANTSANLSDATVGMNTLFYRSKDANGHWSLTNHVPLYIADSSHGDIEEVEYFWDVDPGFGLSDMDTVLANPEANWQGTVMATVPLDLDTGQHVLYMRSKDSRGRWSLTNIVGMVDVDTMISTGLIDSRTPQVSVFPNPFNESFNVRTHDGSPVRITVYDPQGKLVLDRFVNNAEPIDVSAGAAGAYTVFLWKERDSILRTTLIKQ